MGFSGNGYVLCMLIFGKNTCVFKMRNASKSDVRYIK